ncbi:MULTISPECIES: hypothetical protein [unclassified Streptomyces]|uniref:hypothetical protein n=1 Tax=unclassified Streptomyces TaxID=2593676 RepID=UPI000377DEAA|nr:MULTISPECIES: hypothetical protein [unclassified Streptomyces]MYT29868.1 hypothetical protein [Streptomyces sp. SID8354]
MTSPDHILLLPYRTEHTPATAAQPGALALNRMRLTIGNNEEDSLNPPVHCERITFSLPAAPTARVPTGEPVILRTRLDLPRGPGHGRQWMVKASTTDPANTLLTLVPAETARFDGTWALTLTLDISTPLGDTIRVSEDTALDGSSPEHHTRSATLTTTPQPS